RLFAASVSAPSLPSFPTRRSSDLGAGLASRGVVSALLDYCTAGVRVAERSLVQRPRLGREERLVFVVGCPRSGTTFVGRAIGGLDRKSTRLNSSHEWISYAVFCLK